MRDKFELYCKVVGLVFCCVGIYYALSSVPLFFQKAPDVTRFLPQSTLKVFGNSGIAELQASASYMWQYALKQLILLGAVPMLLGWYLMRSNNLFINFCYPCNTPTKIDENRANIQLDMAKEDSPEQPESQGDDRFAPPGYQQ